MDDTQPAPAPVDDAPAQTDLEAETDRETVDAADAAPDAADVAEADVAEAAPDAPRRPPVADLDRALEAILMVVDEPQSLVALASAVDAPVKTVREAVARLVADYDGESGGVRRGFELREVGGGWRIYVRAEHDAIVGDFVLTQNPTKLSQAALETLAVIAYRQPISRGAIASIRAVNVDSVVRTLLGRGLIAEAFTDTETGALHYKTTDLLLVQLGINSIEELPLISPLLADGADGFGDAQ
ncbi:SMC-Scp complex subunit ScpB [Schumannella sp. 10F1B-5-1]|uniref:SMC-Scp complex subunit ScpB n=1 Tax=Schumannella sp. 10F1B-5-1 TaxID=2590780 RepID=UPI00113166CA|nr:SMC-Scp complex subunit ScpB [Schumannella sp. 10F1B-5-1]TPW73740.1 SMC-Scp complex subunit ScpB [Schumannella sp. 10F1B-5-1]